MSTWIRTEPRSYLAPDWHLQADPLASAHPRHLTTAACGTTFTEGIALERAEVPPAGQRCSACQGVYLRTPHQP